MSEACEPVSLRACSLVLVECVAEQCPRSREKQPSPAMILARCRKVEMKRGRCLIVSTIGEGGMERKVETRLLSPLQSMPFFLQSLHCRVAAHSSHMSQRRVWPCGAPLCWSFATARSSEKSAIPARLR